MHWMAGLSALRGVIPTPPAGDRSNRFSSSSADLLGVSSCWNNRRIPTGCWPTGVEGTCFETGNSHQRDRDRKSTRLNSSHDQISYAVFCLKKKKRKEHIDVIHTLHT